MICVVPLKTHVIRSFRAERLARFLTRFDPHRRELRVLFQEV